MLAFATNRTLTVQTWYHHTFYNVVTFQLVKGVWTAVPLPDIVSHIGSVLISVQTTVVTNWTWSPAGTPPVTNTTTFSYLTNVVAGEYFIIPTNLCGISVVALQATLINYDTNVVASATNAPAGTTNSQSFTQVVIDSFPNHAFLINPVLCLPNTIALRQGIEKVSFIRRDFDSLLGQFYSPVTNNYSLTAVTNNQLFPQTVQRVVTQPGGLLNFAWASYDATTNAPVIYPSGTSIANLENQVLIQISPPYLPNGTNGKAYSVQLRTSAATPNWQAPFQWSLAPASPGLPPGLNVSPTGLISGIPVFNPGVPQYNFVIQVTDGMGRIAQQSYVINVAPSP